MTRKDVLELLRKNLPTDCFNWRYFTDVDVDNVLESLPYATNFDYEYGATKLVLLLPETNFVVKIPFHGYCDGETEDDSFDDDFKDFSSACSDRDYYWDYCAAEAIIYQKAKTAKVEKAFAKTVYIGDLDNHPIYIQEKAKTFFDLKNTICSPSFEEIEKTKRSNMKAQVSSWNTTWQTHALKYYGEKQYIKLMQFVRKENINDLGSFYNIGYINNRPVLIDYSSYRS